MSILKNSKLGSATKIEFTEGKIEYVQDGIHWRVSKNNDDITVRRRDLNSKDDMFTYNMKFSQQDEQYGTLNATEYVEYLIINRIFFSEYQVVITDTDGDMADITDGALNVVVKDQPVEVDGEVVVTRDYWLSEDIRTLLLEMKKTNKLLSKIYQ